MVAAFKQANLVSMKGLGEVKLIPPYIEGVSNLQSTFCLEGLVNMRIFLCSPQRVTSNCNHS